MRKIEKNALKLRERCCVRMNDNDYWEDVVDDLLSVLVKTYGIICIALMIVGLFLKIFGYF